MTPAWLQVYDPLGNPWLSTTCAALPVVTLLGSLLLLGGTTMIPKSILPPYSFRLLKQGMPRLEKAKSPRLLVGTLRH